MKKFTFSYYNPYEYPDDITAFGTCNEVLAPSITEAFALVIDNVPIECLETLEINGISFQRLCSFNSFEGSVKGPIVYHVR